jgi:signal transduction histidine kinase
MIVILLGLCLKLSLTVLLAKWRSTSGTKRWCALFVLASVLFEVSDYVQQHIAPSPYVAFVQQVLLFLRETAMPYALLMAAVAYWEPKRSVAALWSALLLVPPVMTAFTLPDGWLRLGSPYFAVWCSGYLFAAVVLLLAKHTFNRAGTPNRGSILEVFVLVLGNLALLMFHYWYEMLHSSGHYALIGVAFLFVLLLIVLSQLESLQSGRRRARDAAAETQRSMAAGMALLDRSLQHRLARLELLAKRIADDVLEPAAEPQSETVSELGVGAEVAAAAAASEAELLAEMEAEWRAELRIEPGTELEPMLALAASAYTVRQQVRKLRAATRRMQLHTAPIELDEQPYSLNELVREAIASVTADSYCAAKKAAVRFRPQLHAVYRCDAEHMRETLLALLRNALDALPAQGGTVEIVLERAGRRMKLSISDNGHGIAPELLPRLGEAFLSTRAGEPDYFGLGLSYARKVVDRHGGKLALESKPGQGTTATVLLPMRRVTALAAAE